MKNKRLFDEFEILLSTYPAEELEDTLFNVFNDAYCYSDGLSSVEKERRAFLHDQLRRIFRESQNINTTQNEKISQRN